VPRGSPDQTRPLRIALAALDVVAHRGVNGLTHRAVAAAAEIPLGSTTYHFKTLDDLLAAAIRQAKLAWDDDLDRWASTLGPDTDFVVALATYLEDVLHHHWDRTIVELELYMTALRRPALRDLSRQWDEALPAVLRRHLDPETAQVLALTSDGLILRALIHGVPSRHEIEAVLRRASR
jgi:DNA-binding transcriptional regulator YbjK